MSKRGEEAAGLLKNEVTESFDDHSDQLLFSSPRLALADNIGGYSWAHDNLPWVLCFSIILC